MNASNISRIIGKTSVRKGKTYKSGLKGQGQRSHEGFKVHTGIEGVIVNYTPATGSSWQGLFEARRHAAMRIIESALIAEGLVLSESSIYSGALVVTSEVK
jgi:hypothetical protein